MADPALVISYEVALSDYRALIAESCSTRRRPNPTWAKLSLFALCLINAFVFAMFVLQQPSTLQVALLFMATCLPVVSNVVRVAGARARLVPRPDGPVLGRRELAVRDDGIEYTSSDCDAFVRWSGFTEVIETPMHVLLMLDVGGGLIIPKRALPSPDALQALLPAWLQAPHAARASAYH